MDLTSLSSADGDLSEADVLFSSSDDLSGHRLDDVVSSPAPPILTRRASAVPKVIEKKKDKKVYSRSAPGRNYMQSAPMRIPEKVRGGVYWLDEEYGDEDMKLPPHEIVARSYVHAMAFSMLEGAGRTLKGWDLMRTRNAIWQKTGYLD